MWIRHRICCDSCRSCGEKLNKQQLNVLNACLAGCLFAIGWWCFIDAASVHFTEFNTHAWYVVPGVASSVAFFLINALAKLPNAQMSAVYMSRSGVWCLRFILFVGFFLAFSMIFVAILMFCLEWSSKTPKPPAPWSYAFAIPQTICICTAMFLYYFGVDINYTY